MCPNTEYTWICELSASTQRNLSVSASCYELAIDLARHGHNCKHTVDGLTKRFGNVQNELGVFFMNKAISLMNAEGKSFISVVCNLFQFFVVVPKPFAVEPTIVVCV